MDSILQPIDLPKSLTEVQPKVILTQEVVTQYQALQDRAKTETNNGFRTRSIGPAQDLPGFFSLVNDAIIHYEQRVERSEEAKIFFTEEEPDFAKSDKITIVHSLKKRLPGAYGKGAPFENNTVNLKPIFREEIKDPAYPGYANTILGYYYDNEVVFTIFAKTNKAANQYAMEFENIMSEYTWFIKMNGVCELTFMSRDKDFTLNNNGVKMYGRPISYFVKTEKLGVISQKTIEQLYIRLSVTNK
jgi:hypothetical protein